MGGIYVSSRVKFSPMWQVFRDVAHYPIRTSWIDYGGPDDITDWGILWDGCIEEASNCSALILYAPDDDILKGALVEVGAAMSHQRPVFYVGLTGPRPLGNLLRNPRIQVIPSLYEALSLATALCPS